MPTFKTIKDLSTAALSDDAEFELQANGASGTGKQTVGNLFGGTGNRDVITAIPGEGANVIPVLGDGIDIPATPTQAQAALPIVFKSSWTGTEAELLAQIAADPTVLVDDGPRLREYILNAITMGWPLIYYQPVYVNTGIGIFVDGKGVFLRCHGNGTIVGGPDLADALIDVSNTSTVGPTPGRSVDCVISGLRTNLQYAPRGALNSIDHIDIKGFRRVHVSGCRFYSGSHYSVAGGDAGIFITANYAVIRDNWFHGCIDLGIYTSGSQTGLTDNTSLLSSGNHFINCANGVGSKRNYQYMRVVGDHFDGCFNCVGTYPASATGTEGKLSGSRSSIVGCTFKNIESCCIDIRASSNCNAVGNVVSGTFGVSYLGAPVANATIIRAAGVTNSYFELVAEVEGATDPTHSAMRISNFTNSVNGITYSSSGNVAKIVAKNIYNGLIEVSPSEKNTVELNLTGVTNPVTMPDGNGTLVIINNDGTRTEMLGNVDKTPGRTPFSAQIFTTGLSIGPTAYNRITRFQPGGSSINVILPSSNVSSGDRVGAIKVAGSGAGFVQLRDPTNTVSLIRLREIGDLVWMVYDGTEWKVDSAYLASNDRMVVDGTPITTSSTATAVQAGRITPVQPGGSSINVVMSSGGVNGDIMGFMKVSGSGAGSVVLRNSTDTTTLATLYNVGDVAFLLCTFPGVWTVIGQRNSTIAALSALQPDANKLVYWTSSTGAALTDFGTFGRSLVGAADAAAARTTLGLGTAATLNTGTSGATIPRNDTTNTFSANQVIAHPTASSILAIQTIDAQESSLRFRTGTSERWRFAKNNASETGANAGSNLILTRFDDAGLSLGTALAITRSNGDIAVGGLIRPITDNAHSLGGTLNRWTGVYTVRVFWSATVFDAFGTGSPEGVVTASVGSTYRRTDGGAATTFYVKESGTGNTGWVAK